VETDQIALDVGTFLLAAFSIGLSLIAIHQSNKAMKANIIPKIKTKFEARSQSLGSTFRKDPIYVLYTILSLDVSNLSTNITVTGLEVQTHITVGSRGRKVCFSNRKDIRDLKPLDTLSVSLHSTESDGQVEKSVFLENLLNGDRDTYSFIDYRVRDSETGVHMKLIGYSPNKNAMLQPVFDGDKLERYTVINPQPVYIDVRTSYETGVFEDNKKSTKYTVHNRFELQPAYNDEKLFLGWDIKDLEANQLSKSYYIAQ
jgi:hypothetical protein